MKKLLKKLSVMRLEERVLFDAAAAAAAVEAENQAQQNEELQQQQQQLQEQLAEEAAKQQAAQEAAEQAQESESEAAAPQEAAEQENVFEAAAATDVATAVEAIAADEGVEVEAETDVLEVAAEETAGDNIAGESAIVPQTTAEIASAIAEGTRHELVIVSNSVHDSKAIIDGLAEGTEVLVLDNESDVLDQINEYLDKSAVKYDAIHVVSHGGDGYLVLNTSVIDMASLKADPASWAAIGEHITEDGDIMLYGCKVAQTENGKAFANQLATLTGADIAASVDNVGGTYGWELEYMTDTVAAPGLTINGYDYRLASFTVAVNADGNYDTALYADKEDRTTQYKVKTIDGDKFLVEETYTKAEGGALTHDATKDKVIGGTLAWALGESNATFLDNDTITVTVDGNLGTLGSITAGVDILGLRETNVVSFDTITVGHVNITGGGSVTIRNGINVTSDYNLNISVGSVNLNEQAVVLGKGSHTIAGSDGGVQGISDITLNGGTLTVSGGLEGAPGVDQDINSVVVNGSGILTIKDNVSAVYARTYGELTVNEGLGGGSFTFNDSAVAFFDDVTLEGKVQWNVNSSVVVEDGIDFDAPGENGGGASITAAGKFFEYEKVSNSGTIEIVQGDYSGTTLILSGGGNFSLDDAEKASYKLGGIFDGGDANNRSTFTLNKVVGGSPEFLSQFSKVDEPIVAAGLNVIVTGDVAGDITSGATSTDYTIIKGAYHNLTIQAYQLPTGAYSSVERTIASDVKVAGTLTLGKYVTLAINSNLTTYKLVDDATSEWDVANGAKWTFKRLYQIDSVFDEISTSPLSDSDKDVDWTGKKSIKTGSANAYNNGSAMTLRGAVLNEGTMYFDQLGYYFTSVENSGTIDSKLNLAYLNNSGTIIRQVIFENFENNEGAEVLMNAPLQIQQMTENWVNYGTLLVNGVENFGFNSNVHLSITNYTGASIQLNALFALPEDGPDQDQYITYVFNDNVTDGSAITLINGGNITVNTGVRAIFQSFTEMEAVREEASYTVAWKDSTGSNLRNPGAIYFEAATDDADGLIIAEGIYGSITNNGAILNFNTFNQVYHGSVSVKGNGPGTISDPLQLGIVNINERSVFNGNFSAGTFTHVYVGNEAGAHDVVKVANTPVNIDHYFDPSFTGGLVNAKATEFNGNVVSNHAFDLNADSVIFNKEVSIVHDFTIAGDDAEFNGTVSLSQGTLKNTVLTFADGDVAGTKFTDITITDASGGYRAQFLMNAAAAVNGTLSNSGGGVWVTHGGNVFNKITNSGNGEFHLQSADNTFNNTVTNSGTFNVDAANTFNAAFSNSGYLTVTRNASTDTSRTSFDTLSNSGTANFNGEFDIKGTYTNTNTGTTNQNWGGINYRNGITNSGIFNVSGAKAGEAYGDRYVFATAVTNNSGATFVLNSGLADFRSTFTNKGTLSIQSAESILGDGVANKFAQIVNSKEILIGSADNLFSGVITNQSAGTIIAQAENTFDGDVTNAGKWLVNAALLFNGNFYNAGTIELNAGSTGTDFAFINNQKDGLINIRANADASGNSIVFGTNALAAASAGKIVIYQNAAENVKVVFNANDGDYFTNKGTIEFRNTSNDFNAPVNNEGTLYFTNSNEGVAPQVIDGDTVIDNKGNIIVAGSHLVIEGTVNNTGTMILGASDVKGANVVPSTQVNFTNASVFTNEGTVSVYAATDFASGMTNAHTLNLYTTDVTSTSGIINTAAGTVNAYRSLTFGTGANAIAMDNQGAVVVKSGNIVTITGIEESTYNKSSYTVDSNAELIVQTSGAFAALSGAVTNSGNVTVKGTDAMTFKGTVTNKGAFAAQVDTTFAKKVDHSGSFTGNGALTFSGETAGSGTLNRNTAQGDVTYNANGNQNVYAGTYQNLIIAGKGDKTVQGDVTVKGDITITGQSTALAGKHNVTFYGETNAAESNAGQIKMSEKAVVTYVADDARDIFRGSYVNLTVDGAGDTTIHGDIAVSKTISNGSGTMTFLGATSGDGVMESLNGAVDYASTTKDQNVFGGDYTDLYLSGNGDRVFNKQVNIEGTLTTAAGTVITGKADIDLTESTVAADGTIDMQGGTVFYGDLSAANAIEGTYFELHLSSNSNTVLTVANDVTVQKQLTADADVIFSGAFNGAEGTTVDTKTGKEVKNVAAITGDGNITFNGKIGGNAEYKLPEGIETTITYGALATDVFSGTYANLVFAGDTAHSKDIQTAFTADTLIVQNNTNVHFNTNGIDIGTLTDNNAAGNNAFRITISEGYTVTIGAGSTIQNSLVNQGTLIIAANEGAPAVMSLEKVSNNGSIVVEDGAAAMVYNATLLNSVNGTYTVNDGGTLEFNGETFTAKVGDLTINEGGLVQFGTNAQVTFKYLDIAGEIIIGNGAALTVESFISGGAAANTFTADTARITVENTGTFIFAGTGIYDNGDYAYTLDPEDQFAGKAANQFFKGVIAVEDGGIFNVRGHLEVAAMELSGDARVNVNSGSAFNAANPHNAGYLIINWLNVGRDFLNEQSYSIDATSGSTVFFKNQYDAEGNLVEQVFNGNISHDGNSHIEYNKAGATINAFWLLIESNSTMTSSEFIYGPAEHGYRILGDVTLTLNLINENALQNKFWIEGVLVINGTAGSAQNFTFAEDVINQGEIKLGTNVLSVTFNGATSAETDGTPGTITTGTGTTVTYGSSAQDVFIGTYNNLVLTGASSIDDGIVTVNGNFTNGTSLEITSDGALILKGAAAGAGTYSNAGTLTFGGTSSVAGAVSNLGTLNANGKNTFAAVTNAGTFNAAGTVTVDDLQNSSKVNVTGTAAFAGTNTGSVIVDGSLTAQGFSGTGSVSVNEDGKLTMNDNGLLSNTVVNAGSVVANGDNAAFGSKFTNSGSLTVNGDNATFNGNTNTGSLTVNGDNANLTGAVNSGTIALRGDNAVAGNLVNTGDLQIRNATASVDNNIQNTDGKVSYHVDAVLNQEITSGMVTVENSSATLSLTVDEVRGNYDVISGTLALDAAVVESDLKVGAKGVLKLNVETVINGDLTNSGVIDTQNNDLTFEGKTLGEGSVAGNSSNTVTYGLNAVNIYDGVYANLVIAGEKNVTENSSVIVNGDFANNGAVTTDGTLKFNGTTSGNGTMAGGEGNVIYNGSADEQTIYAGAYGGITIGKDATGNFDIAGDISVSGDAFNKSANGAELAVDNGTVTYNGTTTQNVMAGNYDELVMAGSGTKLMEADVFNVNSFISEGGKRTGMIILSSASEPAQWTLNAVSSTIHYTYVDYADTTTPIFLDGTNMTGGGNSNNWSVFNSAGGVGDAWPSLTNPNFQAIAIHMGALSLEWSDTARFDLFRRMPADRLPMAVGDTADSIELNSVDSYDMINFDGEFFGGEGISILDDESRDVLEDAVSAETSDLKALLED